MTCIVYQPEVDMENKEERPRKRHGADACVWRVERARSCGGAWDKIEWRHQRRSWRRR